MRAIWRCSGPTTKTSSWIAGFWRWLLLARSAGLSREIGRAAARSVSVANDKAVAGLKLASATSSPTAVDTTNPNLVFTGRGCVALVASHRIKAAKALGAAYDGAAQFLQREAAAPA